jgi:hypothetical protein
LLFGQWRSRRHSHQCRREKQPNQYETVICHGISSFGLAILVKMASCCNDFRAFASKRTVAELIGCDVRQLCCYSRSVKFCV